ncbi:MAG: TetR/AcrR family transcriptional regulator [Saprospiraceae bacterium]
MKKADQTRQMIVSKAAVLFNRQGVSGTSMSDIMEVTGLTKGGLYGNFKSKEELAEAAFEYAVNQVWDEISLRTKEIERVPDKLKAVVYFYKEHALSPPIEGGCPLLNAGAEFDYNHPTLLPKVKSSMEKWHQRLIKSLEKGIERKELKAELDKEQFASVFIACIEGGLLLSQVQKSKEAFSRIANHLIQQIESIQS